MIAQIQGNKVVEYPVRDLRRRFPKTSLPKHLTDDKLPQGYVNVLETPRPAADAGFKVVEGTPARVQGKWSQVWEQVALDDEELQGLRREAARRLLLEAQQALDIFANTREYDGIVALCTYAASSVPKFAREGQRGMELRDALWSAVLPIAKDVRSGARPIPASYADITPELPVLGWAP